MNLLEQVARHIAYLGFGRVPSAEEEGEIFYGTLPDSPDFAICVYATDASYPGSKTGARLQILVRGRTDREAYRTCQDLAFALADYDGFLAGGLSRAVIDLMNGARGLGSDEKKRKLYACNIRLRFCAFDEEA